MNLWIPLNGSSGKAGVGVSALHRRTDTLNVTQIKHVDSFLCSNGNLIFLSTWPRLLRKFVKLASWCFSFRLRFENLALLCVVSCKQTTPGLLLENQDRLFSILCLEKPDFCETCETKEKQKSVFYEFKTLF